MARRPQSKLAEGEAGTPKPCASCGEPLYGTPPFCPFCGKVQAAREPSESPLALPASVPPADPIPSAVDVKETDPPTGPVAENPGKLAATQVSPPSASSAVEPASTGTNVSPGLIAAPISGVPTPKPSPKRNRTGLIVALVVLGVLILAVISRCSGGSEPRRVVHVYDVDNHWMEIETPASGDFALTADVALRIRSGGKTWFIPTNAHARLEGLDPNTPVEVRTVAGRTRVQVLTP